MKEGRGKFGYFNGYLVDTDHAVIMDVEATPARLAQEIIATEAMLKRVEEAQDIKLARLAADKAYGRGTVPGLAIGAEDHPSYRCWIGNTRPTVCCLARKLNCSNRNRNQCRPVTGGRNHLDSSESQNHSENHCTH